MPERLERRGALEVVCFSELEALGVDVLATTRIGGVSSPPYDELNLGDHVGDEPGSVAENRRRLAEEVGVAPADLAIASQVHGVDALFVTKGAVVGSGDVLVTDDPDVAICILVADCVPLVVVDPTAYVVAVAHAGWRGTAANVAGAAVAAAATLGAVPARCHALVGPCISAATYQVGSEVADALRDAGCAEEVVPDGTGRFLADLSLANARHLRAAGVPREHVTRSTLTTDGGTTFFSDRARRPCGRFALVARLERPAS